MSYSHICTIHNLVHDLEKELNQKEEEIEKLKTQLNTVRKDRNKLIDNEKNREMIKMNYEEAIAWLNGERSMTSLISQDPLETWEVRIAQADLAMIQQAYWVVKAHQELHIPIPEDDD